MHPIICTKIHPSDSALMEQIYRLRYQVYVHERGFLSKNHHPQELEYDIYDNHSIHFAALNPQNEVVGTVRLILSEENPTQLDHHQEELNIGVEHTLFPYAEISRFCISKKQMNQFLRKKDLPARSYLNPIAFAFYREMIKECDQLGIDTMFALIENPLATMLKRSGLKLDCVGKAVDIYGLVKPYKFNINEQRAPIEDFYDSVESVLV